MKTVASMKRRRLLIGVATTALMLFFVAQLLTAVTASASAPSSYGWWTQVSLGAPGPTIPPDVPPDGMFVQNLSDPIALSALSFAVPPGASADELTLYVSGTPLISDPPVVCRATSAFEPAQGGSWSDRPSYDCTDPVPGIVSSDTTQVVFPVRELLTSQRSSVVVLAGGQADRIAFEKPGLDALSIKLSTLPSPGFGTLPTFAPIPQPAPFPPLTALPTSPAGQGPALSAPPQIVPSATNEGEGSTRRRVGTTLGVALLLLSILYWSDGFGVVPLRSSIIARIHNTTP